MKAKTARGGVGGGGEVVVVVSFRSEAGAFIDEFK